MADDDDIGGRRSVPRAKVVRAGLIVFDSPSHFEVDCILLDLSVMGAQLDIHGAHGVPDTFRLVVQTERINRACRVVWRNGDRIGVRFVD